MFRSTVFAILVSLLALMPIAASHAQQAMPAADEKRIQAVVLDEKLLSTLKAIAAEGRSFGVEDAEIDVMSASSLDSMAAAALATDPRVGPMLKKHGLSAQDYIASFLALVRAVFAVQAESEPSLQAIASAARAGVNPANIEFVRQHKAEIQSVLQPDEDEGQ